MFCFLMVFLVWIHLQKLKNYIFLGLIFQINVKLKIKNLNTYNLLSKFKYLEKFCDRHCQQIFKRLILGSQFSKIRQKLNSTFQTH